MLRVIINAPLICIALRAITFFRPPAVGQQSLFTRHALSLGGSAW